MQDSPVRFTLDCRIDYENARMHLKSGQYSQNGQYLHKKNSDEHLVSPIEHCLRTKWRDAKIDWNGAEPLL